MERVGGQKRKLTCSTVQADSSEELHPGQVDVGFTFILGELLLHSKRGRIYVYRLLDEIPVYTYQETLVPEARPPPYGCFDVPASEPRDHQSWIKRSKQDK